MPVKIILALLCSPGLASLIKSGLELVRKKMQKYDFCLRGVNIRFRRLETEASGANDEAKREVPLMTKEDYPRALVG